jgi:hypothetical protein
MTEASASKAASGGAKAQKTDIDDERATIIGARAGEGNPGRSKGEGPAISGYENGIDKHSRAGPSEPGTDDTDRADKSVNGLPVFSAPVAPAAPERQTNATLAANESRATRNVPRVAAGPLHSVAPSAAKLGLGPQENPGGRFGEFQPPGDPAQQELRAEACSTAPVRKTTRDLTGIQVTGLNRGVRETGAPERPSAGSGNGTRHPRPAEPAFLAPPPAPFRTQPSSARANRDEGVVIHSLEVRVMPPPAPGPGRNSASVTPQTSAGSLARGFPAFGLPQGY